MRRGRAQASLARWAATVLPLGAVLLAATAGAYTVGTGPHVVGRSSHSRRHVSRGRPCMGAEGDEQGLRVGIIVCDHGSRRSAANDMLLEVTERYRSFSGADIVQPAHMELAEPTIEEAFSRCVDEGAEAIVCHPFFLSPGRHVTSDIPQLMEHAARLHPGIKWSVTQPLGLHPLMPELMHASVSDSVASGEWEVASGGA